MAEYPHRPATASMASSHSTMNTTTSGQEMSLGKDRAFQDHRAHLELELDALLEDARVRFIGIAAHFHMASYCFECSVISCIHQPHSAAFPHPLSPAE